MPNPAFYRVVDLAGRWNCHVDTVRRMVRRGDLAVVRIAGAVRVPHEAVLAYEARQLVPAKQDRPEPDPTYKEIAERLRRDRRMDRALDRSRSR